MLRQFAGMLPLLVLYAVLFVGGLALTFLQSLGLFSPVAQSGPTIQEYLTLFADHSLLHALVFTGYVAFASALLSVLGGTLLACGIWKFRLGKAALITRTGLILPHVAVALIVLLVFGQTGLLASLAYHLGLIDDPSQFPTLLFTGNGLGMILAYFFKGTAFTIIMICAALFGFDPRLIQTARMLGASGTRIFLSVLLPRLLPSLNGAFVILFLYAFGAFDIPFLLGESSPGMLPVRVYGIYFQRDLADRPQAMAILTIMFLLAFAVIFLGNRLLFAWKDNKSQ